MMRLVVLIAVLWSGSAWAQNQTLNAYVNSLPVAPSLGPTDQFYIRQGGVSKQLLGSALPGMTYVQPYAYPFGSSFAPTYNPGQGVASGQVIPYLNENTAWIQPSVYPTQFIATNQYAVGYYASSVTCSSCAGKVFELNFTSASINGGSPVSVAYTAVNADTSATVATGLCNAVQANANLQNALTGFPIYCDPTIYNNGEFNLSWSILVEPITITTTGSTGTVTLNVVANANNEDAVVYQFQRNVPGYAYQTGDEPLCLQLGSQGAVAMLQICASVQNASPFASQVFVSTLASGGQQFATAILANGIVLPDVNHNNPTFEGYGTINIPAAGGYYANGVEIIAGNGAILAPSVTGGSAVGSSLVLASTSNVLPSGDSLALQASTISVENAAGLLRARFTSVGETLSNGYRIVFDNSSGVSDAYLQENNGNTVQLVMGASAAWGFYLQNGTAEMDFGATTPGQWTINSVATFTSNANIAGMIVTAAAPTVAASQIGYGSTVAAASSCGSGGTGCIVVNIAGTTRYVPYY